MDVRLIADLAKISSEWRGILPHRRRYWAPFPRTYYDWNLYYLQVAGVDKEMDSEEISKFADLVRIIEY